MIKKFILLLVGVFGVGLHLARSQSITPQVVSSNGNFSSASWGSLSSTVGEAAIVTLQSTGNFLTQGFQQPQTLSVGVYSPKNSNDVVTVFPNPAINFTLIDVISESSGTANFQLFDIQGKIIQNGSFDVIGGAQNQHRVLLNNLASGMYLISVTSPSATTKNFKIQKTN